MMMPRVSLLVALVALSTTALGMPHDRAAAQTPSVVVSAAPESGKIARSRERFDVWIAVADVQNLGAFNVRLTFDPNVLRPLSIVKTDFLGSSGREVVCPDPIIADDNVKLQCNTLRQTPAGVDGSGTLATVTFEPIAEGSSPLTLEAHLSHPDGGNIPSVAEDARVKIGGDDMNVLLWIGIGIGAAVIAGAGAGFVISRRRRRKPGQFSI